MKKKKDLVISRKLALHLDLGCCSCHSSYRNYFVASPPFISLFTILRCSPWRCELCSEDDYTCCQVRTQRVRTLKLG